MKKLVSILMLFSLSCAPVRVFNENSYNINNLSDNGYVKIVFDSDVDEDSVSTAIDAIKAAQEQKAKAIFFEINTNGGSVEAGFRLSKTIENSPVPVICVVDYKALSMGMYILQSCQVRAMTKRSFLMTHQPAIRTQVSGDQDKWREVANLLANLNLALMEHIIARTNVSIQEIKNKTAGSNAWWIAWREAEARKFVDIVADSTSDVINQWLVDPSLGLGK